MAEYRGVDISYCNTAVNYAKLKSGQIDGHPVKFAMIRTSYGTSKDKLLDKHYNGCKSAKLYVGAYHWLKAQTPEQARQEAEWLCRLLKNYTFDYPIALDFEDSALFALKLTKEQYSAIVDAFMSVLIAANYYVVLYTNPDTIRNRLTDKTLKEYDLWLAHWTHGSPPAEYGQTMWQYAAYGTSSAVSKGWATDVGSVEGSGGPIDVDVAYVGYAAKIRKLGKNKPVLTYKITATKKTDEATANEAAGQLRAQGYTVTVSKS